MLKILKLCALVLLAIESSSFASVQFAKITNIAVDKNQSGSLIDIQFDKPFSAKQLKPAYERNFIQLVFKGTKMDAARIIPAAMNAQNSNAMGNFAKVFAYAYTPDTSRVRLIFNADKAPQGKVTLWNLNPKTIRIQIKEKAAEKTVTSQAVAAIAPVAPVEEKLLKEVTDNTKDVDLHNPETIKTALNDEKKPEQSQQVMSAVEKTVENTVKKTEPIGRPEGSSKEAIKQTQGDNEKQIGTRTEPTKYFIRMIAALMGVLAIFLGGVFFVKRYSNKLNKLPFGKKERIIQVVATHYVGNKKSISLVRVAGEYMVVGVGNDGMTLLSKLDKDANIDKYIDERFWGGTFEKHLKHYEKDPAIMTEEKTLEKAAPAKKSGFFTLFAKNNTDKNTEQLDDAVDIGEVSFGKNNKDFYPSDGFSDAVNNIEDKVELSSGSALRERLTKLKPLS